MKWLVLIIPVLLAGCMNRKEKVSSAPKPETVIADTLPKIAEIAFPVENYNAGKVPYDGDKIRYTFKFYNKGTAPLIISDVKTACSCTVPTWTKTQVMPKDSGIIKVEFDTKGYQGHFSKWMTVYANGSRPSAVLTIMGEIVVPPDFTPPGEKHE